VKAARAEILEKMVLVDEYKVEFTIASYAIRGLFDQLNHSGGRAFGLNRDIGPINSLFEYYQELARLLRGMGSNSAAFREPLRLIKILLKNKMVSFPGTHDSSAFTKGRFLCARVAGEGLPWDVTQKDW
jgi:hypothetical protein